jgi:hypothetical protein
MGMKVTLLLLAALLAGCLTGCSASPTSAEKVMLAIWTNSSATPEEKAGAIMRCYTNGTPVSKIAFVLGKGGSGVVPFSSTNGSGGPAHPWLLYKDQKVTILSSAPLGSDPLSGNFIGVGIWSETTTSTNATRERAPSADEPPPVSATQGEPVVYFGLPGLDALRSGTNFVVVLTNNIFTNPPIEIRDDSDRPIFRRPSSLDLIETDPKR